MTVLVATDLDRTLVYSQRSLGPRPGALHAVEHRGGSAVTWTTVPALGLLSSLGAAAPWVPATTRTRDQFGRLHLPGAGRWAVCAHGGVLLDDGVPDRAWSARVRRRVARSASLGEVAGGFERHVAALPPDAAGPVRRADDLFLVARLHPPEVPDGWSEDLARFAADRGWTMLLGERKVHLVPDGLSKLAAVNEVRGRCGADRLLAAGDSWLDADLLLAADVAIRPAHGELHELGWRAPHVAVTAASGAPAGEEILRWLLARTG